MKRICSALLCAVLLASLLSTVAWAADDAGDLHYELVLSVSGEGHTEKTNFAVGDTFMVELALRRTGAGVGKLYAAQGELRIDAYNVRFVGYEGIAKAHLQSDRVSFAYLDMSGNGVEMKDPQSLGKFQFTALKPYSTNRTPMRRRWGPPSTTSPMGRLSLSWSYTTGPPPGSWI